MVFYECLERDSRRPTAARTLTVGLILLVFGVPSKFGDVA
jgi:hypothetical protein